MASKLKRLALVPPLTTASKPKYTRPRPAYVTTALAERQK